MAVAAMGEEQWGAGLAPPTTGRGVAKPFRLDAGDLVEMFQTLDAGTPDWHRTRARTLLREANSQPVAAVTNLWWRLAARHMATAELLEEHEAGTPVVAPVERRRRFFR
jgi:hypothetical protein